MKRQPRFIAVNYLFPGRTWKNKEKIVPDPENVKFVLPADVILENDSTGCRKIYEHGVDKIYVSRMTVSYFWNMDELEAIQSCIRPKTG